MTRGYDPQLRADAEVEIVGLFGLRYNEIPLQDRETILDLVYDRLREKQTQRILRVQKTEEHVRRLEAESKAAHTTYWYAVRHQRLDEWARERLSDELQNEYFSIIANGTATVSEVPTYAQLFNTMKHKLEAAEAELAKWKK